MNIREKIQKIIDKAKSTTSEAEADALLAKAHKLMEEHQIAEHELGDQADPMGMTVGLSGQSGPSAYKPALQRALARYYGACPIRMWQDQRTYRNEIVGAESARITTELITEYVWDQVKAKASALTKEHGGNRGVHIRSITNALVSRIIRLTAEQAKAPVNNKVAQHSALVIVPAQKAWMEAHYKNLVQTKGGKRSTTEAARQAAGSISLHRQTGGSSTLRIGG